MPGGLWEEPGGGGIGFLQLVSTNRAATAAAWYKLRLTVFFEAMMLPCQFLLSGWACPGWLAAQVIVRMFGPLRGWVVRGKRLAHDPETLYAACRQTDARVGDRPVEFIVTFPFAPNERQRYELLLIVPEIYLNSGSGTSMWHMRAIPCAL